MKTNTHIPASGFSWRRVWNIALFYRPTAEKQLLWYLIISVVCAIVTLLPIRAYAQVGLFSIIWTALPLLLELAPCMLAKSGDYRIVERMIPASPAGKYTFRLIYFLIVIPLACQLLPRLALVLYEQIPAIQTEDMTYLVKASLEYPFIVWAVNIMTVVGSTLTCLYVVSRVRTNRTLKGILATFAFQICVSLLGAIWGFSSAFKLGLDDGLAGYTRNPEEYTKMVIDNMISSPYMIVSTTIIGLYVILMLVLNYRVLYKRNL